MIDILAMGEKDLLGLDPGAIKRLLTAKEIIHIFSALGGLWLYDYEAAEAGRPGLHALLKSERHSNGFLNSKVVLCHRNIRWILAHQLVMRWRLVSNVVPKWVAGIPDGATGLGEDFAEIIGSQPAEMEKVDGVIRMVSKIMPGESLLLIEDFCTRGTGFVEAVTDIHQGSPQADILRHESVLMNRGGLEVISVPGVGDFKIEAAATHRINDWDPKEGCPICDDLGSEVIKPKAPAENWDIIMNSQKKAV